MPVVTSSNNLNLTPTAQNRSRDFTVGVVQQEFVATLQAKLKKSKVSAREFSRSLGRSGAYIAKITALENGPSRQGAVDIMAAANFGPRQVDYFTKNLIPTLKG